MKKNMIALAAAAVLAVPPATLCLAQEDGLPAGPGGWQEEGGGPVGAGPDMSAAGQGRFAEGTEGAPRKGMRWMRPGRADAGDDKAALDLIKKHDPALAGTLEELRRTSPEKYRVVMRNPGRLAMAARMEKDENMEKDAVRAFSLEYGTNELARRYDKAPDGERDKIKKELGEKVAQLFDIRLKLQEAKLLRMEKDLARLRKNIANRKANKARIVEERVGQLTGDGYGW